MLHRCISALAALSLSASAAAAQNLDSLLARMTLEEKLGQLNLLSANGRASPQQMELLRAGKLSWRSEEHTSETPVTVASRMPSSA